MKFTVTLEIDLPREQVVPLLADPEQLPMWLRGLVSHTPLDGEHGAVGTTSRVVMREGKGTMEARETITRREPLDLQDLASDEVVHYERELVAEGMWSAAREHLSEAAPGRTLWVSENEYRFDALPMRLLAPLMRGAFRNQTLLHMRDFAAFAEHGTDVREQQG